MRILVALLFAGAAWAQPYVDYPLQIKRPPALDARTYQFTRTNGSGASGNLAAAGAGKTITVTPCPLGINGTDTNHYLYISAGTGTAEAALITSGTCTTGASSGTIVVTTANTHTGAWKISSASAGIVEAIWALPAQGGSVRMPCGTLPIYQTIIVGNGTATDSATRNAIELFGCGSGRGQDIAFPTEGATSLQWAGPAGGTVVKVLGPVGNVILRDFQVDAMQIANIGLDVVHSYWSIFKNINIMQWESIGLQSMAVDFNFPAMANGNNHNRFEDVFVTNGTGSASMIACRFGQGIANTLSPFDFASNTMINSECNGAAGIGLELRFADSNTFISTWFLGDTAGIKFSEVAGTSGFPASNVFLHSLAGGPTIASPTNYIPVVTNSFFPYAEEGTVTPLGALNTFATGITYQGHWFGRVKNAPLRYSTATRPAAIANTVTETAFARSYTFAANELNLYGSMLRVRAAGRLSTTGTPLITFRVKLGSTAIGTFILTCPNNASNAGFSVESSFGVEAIGSAATVLIGPSLGQAYNPLTLVQSGPVGSFTVGQQGPFNLTTTQTVTLTVEWGAASASNTATLDVMTVDLTYPGATQ